MKNTKDEMVRAGQREGSDSRLLSGVKIGMQVEQARSESL
jgi:hypothetical protein